jgi:hypothetical protein
MVPVKKLLALLVMAVMVCATVGCGDKDTKGSGGGPKSTPASK